MKPVRSLTDVVDWRMCLGCGACAYICPQQKVQLWDFPSEGIRPVVDDGTCDTCKDCLSVCPAVEADYRREIPDPALATTAEPERAGDAIREWGVAYEIWEGFASDPEIRFKGSSGGILTALAAYCVEQAGMHGVLHTGADAEDPVRNRTRLSRTREEILCASGSRYSPASVCDGLGVIEECPSPCAVIGKPSEIAAIHNARRLRPRLDASIGVTMSFFCAESPSTGGTLALLNKLGVDAKSVESLRYRGDGWPGHFAPIRRGEKSGAQRMPYRESWAFLQAYRPWSTHQWPDGTGELADISCGDPWYEKPDGENPGFSLIVVRSETGRKIVQGALEAGYIEIEPAEFWKFEKSQLYLLRKKGEVWGRRLAARVIGLPVMRDHGMHLFHCWKKLPTGTKIRSVLGTFKRIASRKFYRRLRLDRAGAVLVKSVKVSDERRESIRTIS